MPDTPRCEHRKPNGVVCGTFAWWRVSRLYRKSDAQNSCRQHLSATVNVLIGIDDGERAAVTVTCAGAASG